MKRSNSLTQDIYYDYIDYDYITDCPLTNEIIECATAKQSCNTLAQP